METMNGGQGGEDARQIAPGVARSDYRAGWAIVVIALVFLFCPGCSYTAPANPVPEAPTSWPDVAVVVVCLAFVALLVWSPYAAARGINASEKGSAERITFDTMSGRLAKEKAARIEAEQYLRAARVRVRDLEADLEHMRSKVAADQAALDACAELLSGPNAPGEHTAARVALRATGRLGGATAEPKP